MWCGCTEHWPLDRRQLLQALAAFVRAGCAPKLTAANRDDALRLQDESPSVDLHSHPGIFPSSPLSTGAQVSRMERGKVRASLFAAVADGPLIGRKPPGGLYASREPRPGELYAYTWQSLDAVRPRAAAGTLTLVRSPAEVSAAHTPGALLPVEGGDFLEGQARACEGSARPRRAVHPAHALSHRPRRDTRDESPRHGRRRRPPDGYIQHIVRMIDAVGVDHVGIGTDMDGISPPAFVSFTDYGEWPSITGTLLARGYSREEVAKVMGGNFLRVYRASVA